MTPYSIAPKQDKMPRPGTDDAARSAFRAAFRTAFLNTVAQELTPRQHAALCLYYLDGLSQQQIAALWHITPSAVSRHLHRARARLRRLLDGAPILSPLASKG